VPTRWINLCLVLLTFAGCSDPDRPTLVPATGRVTMNGQPLTAGAIIFHPGDGNPYMKDKPSSLLQLDGSFTMKTFPFGEGVSPGPYKVTLAPELATRIGRPELAHLEQTPLTVDVPVTGLSDHLFVVAESTAAAR
jgi:hypothetical protein